MRIGCKGVSNFRSSKFLSSILNGEARLSNNRNASFLAIVIVFSDA